MKDLASIVYENSDEGLAARRERVLQQRLYHAMAECEIDDGDANQAAVNAADKALADFRDERRDVYFNALAKRKAQAGNAHDAALDCLWNLLHAGSDFDHDSCYRAAVKSLHALYNIAIEKKVEK